MLRYIISTVEKELEIEDIGGIDAQFWDKIKSSKMKVSRYLLSIAYRVMLKGS